MQKGDIFYTILNTHKNSLMGYSYQTYAKELPRKDLDHKRMTYNGFFCVNADNPQDLNNKLLELHLSGERVILDYGNRLTGESWNEEFDITGRIGRSTGSIPIPILVHNRNSTGGGALLDGSIISIKSSKGKRPLWKIGVNISSTAKPQLV